MGWWPAGTRRNAAALVCLAAGAPAAEAAALHTAGLDSVIGIAPQVTAPPPFGAYHDLRWAFVFHFSWWGFGLELAGLVVFRALLNTALTLLAWPAARPRPGTRRLLVSNALCTLLIVVLLSPWATLAALGAGTSLSWFVIGSVLGVGLAALVLNRGGIVPGWWRCPPTFRTIGIALLTIVVLCAGSTAISLVPGWWAVVVAAVVGTANTVLWTWLVRTVAGRSLPVIPAFVTPLALAAVPAVLLGAGGYVVGLSQSPPSPPPERRNVDRLSPAGGRQVIYIEGYGSHYSGQRVPGYPPSVHFTYFSYRGQYPDGAPLPYGPGATHQSISVLARRLAEQVEDLHARTGEPVAVVAHSEGTFIVRAYLRGHRTPSVDTVVLLSPLVRPVRIYYPPADADSGPGIALGWEARGLTALTRLMSGSTSDPDEGFARSILTDGPFYRDRMMCPVPNVRIVAYLPTASAAAVPPGHLSDVPVVEVRAVHGSLTSNPDLRREITATLTGGPLPRQDITTYRLVQGAAAGWQVPPLPIAEVPAWHASGAPDAALSDTDGCDLPVTRGS